MDLISIVVPIYKVEKYLHRCVDSILNQTYKNIEVILVNDGSPDKCGEICDAYASLDQRVKVIHKKNGGLSDARNAGIVTATGNYITFIDSDDWIHKEYIERLYRLIVDSDSDISVCNFVKVSEENTPPMNILIEDEDIQEFSNIEALEQLHGKYCFQLVIACGKLYKNQLFENIRFPLGRIHEDEFTTYKLIYEANKIIYTNTPLLFYWQREDSIMGSGFNLKSRYDITDALKEKAFFLEEIGLGDLSDKMYVKSFITLIGISRKARELNLEIDEEEFERKFKGLVNISRRRKFSLKFRVLFELYYIFPSIMDNIFNAYVKFKSFRGYR